MRLYPVNQDIAGLDCDAIIVNLFEGVTSPGGATGAVDRALGGLISRLSERGEIKGKLNETTVIYTDQIPARKVVVVGLGPAGQFNLERARQAAGSAIRAAGKGGTRVVGTIVHGAGTGGLEPAACARALAEGTILASYRYEDLKSEKSQTRVEELIVAERDRDKCPEVAAGLERGTIMARATNFARDLVNSPANHMTPTHLAEAARALACELELECTVLERADMERLGMGALLGVAQGSLQPPKLIVLRYHGAPGAEWLALAGKGLTFDSGGLSLKPADGMENMKSDMAGGAAVLGAMQAIGKLRPRVNLVAIVACTENLPSGSALKPGDVVRAMTGKTIEIVSTDAEGRLILADAVGYAVSQGATRVVDVATLTGACGVALGGGFYSGLVANCDRLASRILEAAGRAGERVWRFPSDPDYQELYKSDVADIKNVGGRLGGAITGGMIIGEFAGSIPWAHLDIAPTSFAQKEKPYQPKGATGVAVRTLVELVL
ncbi:MAG: leucyl aminopeptidase [Bacillota bacterium]